MQKHPVLHKADDKAADGGGDNLSPEHEARWHFHIVTNFKISGKTNCLVSSDEGDALEDHVGNRATWDDVTGKHLVDYLQRDLLISGSLKHSHRDSEESREEECEEETPDWELCWEDLDGDD